MCLDSVRMALSNLCTDRRMMEEHFLIYPFKKNLKVFTLIETSQICNFILSEFEFFCFFIFSVFLMIQSFSLCCIDLVNMFCVISTYFLSKLYPFGIVFHFEWVVKFLKFFEIFYDNSYVFGSAAFDRSLSPLLGKLFSFIRACLLFSCDINMKFL